MAIDPNVQPDTPQPIKDAQLTKNLQEVDNKLNRTNVMNDEDGVPHILIGRQDGGFGTENHGIKVSQQGIDVRDATDNQLVMSSAFNMYKIVQTGQVTLNGGATDGTSYTKVYSHNLGYRPMVLVQCELPSALGGETVEAPYTFTQWNGGTSTLDNRVHIDYFIENNDITFRMVHDSIIGAEDFIFKYYILAETGVS